MGFGRFVCVALPLVLTLAAIVALLVATLSGVSHQSLFRVNVSGLSVDSVRLGSIASQLGINGLGTRADGVGNITAARLGLDVYDMTLWGFCRTAGDGARDCTKAQFDWASHYFNTTWLDNLGAVTGVKVALPCEVENGLHIYRTVNKWTEVAFVVALVALGLELLGGVLASQSRVASCLTWLAAGLATALASIVAGAVEGTARPYGVTATVGGPFLAAAWITFALAAGAAFFWLFTICCCMPEHCGSRSPYRRAASKHRNTDSEKLLPATYAPLGNGHEMSGAAGHNANRHSHLGHHNAAQPPRYPGGSDMAYEPYSHRA